MLKLDGELRAIMNPAFVGEAARGLVNFMDDLKGVPVVLLRQHHREGATAGAGDDDADHQGWMRG
ncbi:hypothetical protein [Mesorhizobium sp. 43Arga]